MERRKGNKRESESTNEREREGESGEGMYNRRERREERMEGRRVGSVEVIYLNQK